MVLLGGNPCINFWKEDDMEEFFKVRELATKLKVAPVTIYKMVSRGKLPAVRVGRSIRFDPAALDGVLGTSLCKE